MTLIDAGPLIALLYDDDRYHTVCVNALASLARGPLWTTWPCFTEAMHILYSLGGFPAQDALWRIREDGRLLLIDLSLDETRLAAVLMRQYSSVPMDLADASLVAVAEHREVRQLLTIDSDFYTYRLKDAGVVKVLR